MILLKNIDVGTQGMFQYSPNLVRIGFVKSITHMAVVPILHRNIQKLQGIRDVDDYTTYKVSNEKMYALSKTGILQTWNITNGKEISCVDLSAEHCYTEKWDFVSQLKSDRMLMKSKENVTGENNSNHFLPFQQIQQLPGQQTYLQGGYHTYKNWK